MFATHFAVIELVPWFLEELHTKATVASLYLHSSILQSLERTYLRKELVLDLDASPTSLSASLFVDILC